jgi:hypothetical protein
MSYLVAYAKLVQVRDGGVALHGDTIYLAGIADTPDAAERLARATVNCHSPYARGHVLPRVFRRADGASVIDGMYNAMEWFEQKLKEMNEADEIISRGRR